MPSPESSAIAALSDDPADPFRRVPRAPPRRFGLAIFRHVFVPFVLAIAIAPWTVVPPLARHPMPLVLPFAMLLIWLAEQVFPFDPAWNVRPLTDGIAGWKRLGRDLVYLVVVAQVSAWLVASVSTQLEPWLQKTGLDLGAHRAWISDAPRPARIALAFLVVELGSYGLHRASHHFDVLWRFHATHHVITDITGLKALRTHPVENLLFALVRTTPLLLLGVAADDVITVTCLGGILGFLSHANVDVNAGVFGWIVNLPRIHAVHHSADVEESRSNFGCHTVVWDRVFGTFRCAAREPLVVGVHPVGERSLWDELVRPFYRRPQ